MLLSLLTATGIVNLLLLAVSAAPTPQPRPISVPLKRGLSPSLTKRGAASHPLWHFAPIGYLIDVNVGTPSQNFTVLLDTGSADLWIPSSACSQASGCLGKTFDASQSSTLKNTSVPFDIVYGSGFDNGTYVKDVVQVGDFVINDQVLALVYDAANTTKSARSTPYMDGILGMTWDTGVYGAFHNYTYPPFIYGLYSTGQIPTLSFGLHLGGLYSKGYAGTVTFGGIDSSQFTGNLQYLPAQPENVHGSMEYVHWTVYAQSFKLQNANTNYEFPGGPALVALDSGSTFAYLPRPIVEGILHDIAGNNYQPITSSTFQVPCGLLNTTEVIEVTFPGGGNSAPLTLQAPVKDIVMGQTDGVNDVCLLGISAVDDDSLYILGDTFLRNWYLNFDFTNKQVGLAPAVNSNDPQYYFNVNDIM
ncbi:aspartic peptidase domain-containing protein [Umbelopsis sp. PMI_123]|nr:aspartic peptidase domain-containing protein [Umbelopsis sp. PMI_123]